MSEEEGYDPYKEWKSQIYTFILCWKHGPMVKHTYQKDLIKNIVDMIPVDFTKGKFHACKLRVALQYYEKEDEFRYGLWWLEGVGDWTGDASWYPVCRVCFRPCSTIVEPKDRFIPLRKCSQESHRDQRIPSCCRHGTCQNCIDELCKRENILLAENFRENEKNE